MLHFVSNHVIPVVILWISNQNRQGSSYTTMIFRMTGFIGRCC
ncbi:MAG: hypothetical protein WAQ02_04035 [Methanosarcina flavescens]